MIIILHMNIWSMNNLTRLNIGTSVSGWLRPWWDRRSAYPSVMHFHSTCISRIAWKVLGDVIDILIIHTADDDNGEVMMIIAIITINTITIITFRLCELLIVVIFTIIIIWWPNIVIIFNQREGNHT